MKITFLTEEIKEIICVYVDSHFENCYVPKEADPLEIVQFDEETATFSIDVEMKF